MASQLRRPQTEWDANASEKFCFAKTGQSQHTSV
jgi:hypothetical protein